MKTLRPLDHYLPVETAMQTHLARCPACPTGTCAAGFELLRDESAAWTAFEQADPRGAAEYRVRAAEYAQAGQGP